MNIERRRFLTIAGLTGLGAAVGGQWLLGSGAENSSIANIDRPKSKLLLRFASIADTGSSTLKQYTVGRAIEKYHQQYPLDLVIMAGDNIYNDGEIEKINSAFNIPYEALRKKGVKFYACLGNHDVRTQNGDAQVAFPEFNMQGKRYYTFSRDRTQFFVLETNDLRNPKSTDRQAQIAWLDRELTKSKATWKIVYGHHNVFSVGRYGVDRSMVETLTPILAKHKVKLWINGHDHNYQRTKEIDGTTYLTTGGGGATLYPIIYQADWSAFAQSIHSFGVVEVYQDRLFVQGVSGDGKILDRAYVMA
jgi:3',5'-cyclic AMP phosphodiesterase CpdA